MALTVLDLDFRGAVVGLALNLVMAGLTSSVHAQGTAGAGNNSAAAPGPAFSDTGPDAAAYGAAAGYPAGARAASSQIEHLVNTYSHFGELFSSRQVRRATTPWLFKRA